MGTDAQQWRTAGQTVPSLKGMHVVPGGAEQQDCISFNLSSEDLGMLGTPL